MLLTRSRVSYSLAMVSRRSQAACTLAPSRTHQYLALHGILTKLRLFMERVRLRPLEPWTPSWAVPFGRREPGCIFCKRATTRLGACGMRNTLCAVLRPERQVAKWKAGVHVAPCLRSLTGCARRAVRRLRGSCWTRPVSARGAGLAPSNWPVAVTHRVRRLRHALVHVRWRA